MLIGLVGVARSGKDTIANYLADNYGFHHAKFSQGIKDLLYIINPQVQVAEREVVQLQDLVDGDGWDWCKDKYPIVREMLQRLGTEGGRDFFNPNVWVNRTFSYLRSTFPVGSANDVVISDCRFPNEIDAIHERGGEVWVIVRPGFGPVNDHISDRAWQGCNLDVTIYNDSTPERMFSGIDLYLSNKGLTKIAAPV